jgi:hypothetical protein
MKPACKCAWNSRTYAILRNVSEIPSLNHWRLCKFGYFVFTFGPSKLTVRRLFSKNKSQESFLDFDEIPWMTWTPLTGKTKFIAQYKCYKQCVLFTRVDVRHSALLISAAWNSPLAHSSRCCWVKFTARIGTPLGSAVEKVRWGMFRDLASCPDAMDCTVSKNGGPCWNCF